MTNFTFDKSRLYSEIAKCIRVNILLGSNTTNMLIQPELQIVLKQDPSLGIRGILKSVINANQFYDEKKCQDMGTRSNKLSDPYNDIEPNPLIDYKTKIELIKAIPDSIHTPDFKSTSQLHAHVYQWTNSQPYWMQPNQTHDSTSIEEIIDYINTEAPLESYPATNRLVPEKINDNIFGYIFESLCKQPFDPKALIEADPTLDILRKTFLTDLVEYLTDETYVDHKFNILPEEIDEVLNSKSSTYKADMIAKNISLDKYLSNKWAVTTEFEDFTQFAESLNLEPGQPVQLTILKPTSKIEGFDGTAFVISRTAEALLDAESNSIKILNSSLNNIITIPTITKAKRIL